MDPLQMMATHRVLNGLARWQWSCRDFASKQTAEARHCFPMTTILNFQAHENHKSDANQYKRRTKRTRTRMKRTRMKRTKMMTTTRSRYSLHRNSTAMALRPFVDVQ